MTKIKNQEEFKKFVKENKKEAYITAIAEIYNDSKGNIINAKILTINVKNNYGTASSILDYLDKNISNKIDIHNISTKNTENILENYFFPYINDGQNHSNIIALDYAKQNNKNLSFIVIKNESLLLEDKVSSICEANLKLALISRGYYKPNSLNLDGLFAVLPNLVWTNKACHSLEDWNQYWFIKQNEGEFVLLVDKFPAIYQANPVLEGVRVTNASMVRNGAYLGKGTTVMHYGFINFNAGTLGVSMVEGRISAGNTVEDGTDLGAGSGMLGTLSGGNSTKIKVGKNCLLGVNSEIGIPLGDNVLVKEGTVFSSNTPIELIQFKTTKDNKFISDEKGKPQIESKKLVKAKELAGISNVTFRVNSQNGKIEVLPIPNKVQLNDLLHKND